MNMPIQIQPNRIKIKNGNDTQSIQIFTDNELNTASNDYITPEQYGATGDGETNDKAAIQDAIDAATQYNPPKPIVFKNTYFIEMNEDTNPIVINKDNLKLIFEKNAKIITNYIMHNSQGNVITNSGHGIFHIKPNEQNNSGLTQIGRFQYSRCSFEMYIGNSSETRGTFGLMPGDFIEISYKDKNNASFLVGIFKITWVRPSTLHSDGNLYYLSHAIPQFPVNDNTGISYGIAQSETISTFYYKKINMINGIEIIGDNSIFEHSTSVPIREGGNFFLCEYCNDLKISGIYAKSRGGRFCEVRRSYNSIIQHSTWEALGRNTVGYGQAGDNVSYTTIDPIPTSWTEDLYNNIYKTPTPAFYEAFVDINSTGTIFDNCTVFNSAGGIDFGGSIYGIANNCRCYEGKLRTHGLGAKQISFNNCYVHRQTTENTTCATFGNLASGTDYQNNDSVIDSHIYCNNCYFYGGVAGVYIQNKTTNVFLNNCRFENQNNIIRGANNSERAGIIYLNMCSYEHVGEFKSGNFQQIFINNQPFLEQDNDTIKSQIIILDKEDSFYTGSNT